MSNQTLTYNTPTALTANGFTKTGSTFAGWSTTAGGAVAYANTASYTIGAGNVTLYAQWTSPVTFNGNGSDGGSTANQNIVTNTSAALTSNGFTRTGYTFSGWNTLANNSGTAYANGASYTMTTTNPTLYAQWTLSIPVLPSVATSSAVTSTGATFGSSISVGAALTARGTCWGTTPAPTTNCLADGSTALGSFAQVRTGLTPGTLYYFRGYATNAAGTGYSLDGSTTTLSAPTVTSPTVNNVTNTTADFGGNVTSSGGTAITGQGTCWGTSPSPATNCQDVGGGYGVGGFVQSRTVLTPGTLIYYRGYATNSVGTSYSVDGSTTTLPNLTGVTVTPGNTQAKIDYTTSPFTSSYSVLILRSTSAVVDTPVDSTAYIAGNQIGAATVACVDASITAGTNDSCTASSLTNTTPYYFKVFTKDASGKYTANSPLPDGSPSTPDVNATLVNISSFRPRNDDGGETSATYLTTENTPVTSAFYVGDKLRLRLVVENQKTALTNKTYQLEYATSSCTTWIQVPRPVDATYQDWRVEPSSFLSDNMATTHSASVTVPNGKAFKAGRAQTFNSVTQPIILKNSEYTEIEYSLRSTANTIPYIPYCFRLTGAGDASDFTYSQVVHITSNIRRQDGGGGGGTIARPVEIEQPSAAPSGQTLGGTVKTEQAPAAVIEKTVTPAAQQSTTTPTRRRGGGGDVGVLQYKNKLALTSTPAGEVLGVSSAPMCTDMQSHMTYGVADTNTKGEVSELQYYLQKKGYFNTTVTGNYLDITKAAVMQFQKDNHLIVTGIAGKVTREKMKELGCVAS